MKEVPTFLKTAKALLTQSRRYKETQDHEEKKHSTMFVQDIKKLKDVLENDNEEIDKNESEDIN
jgi:hypothetical protein